ncbi:MULTISPECIES: type II and III secretion system protein family protein [unclassified Bradyrhizobium]|uniref:type II and III secretion system protein family protein n=1 Tax=unclassified Bradyrhizobium TaxID=2631580 RepID=UPI001BA8FA2E|nr:MULTISPECIES: type II and III secretion system protein family protein [unclassified Bradyrhizobium]MBR1205523.1 type II and III secretion system protein family protein [Bradyrhizobium sp. AUGA SZCCT0124]MBR1314028.1 type II and III secretion system protein family protein [Bradyrhizobium sp. AUGA SZCCT0051]MBR1337850.1 type II and III secretion system protein family protein [Bradyrhizobium sp. AUGA SZCCT0105]MBR1360091.1 type II and III secretion system protein family protein [Bradyrhizobium 
MSGGRVWGSAGRNFLALGLTALGGALAVFNSADHASAAERRQSSSGSVFVSEVTEVQRVKVTLNKSRTFRVDSAFATIVAGSPDIVDVKSLSDHLIYVQGKKTGTTNVILFDNSMKQIGILDVEVTLDIGNLQQNISSGTGTRGIRVSASEGQVVLSGMAADAVAAEKALAIAKGSVPEGGIVVNAMSVAAPQQVMLEVRFLEVSRQAGRDLGVNLFAANANGTNVANTGLGSATARRVPIGGNSINSNGNATTNSISTVDGVTTTSTNSTSTNITSSNNVGAYPTGSLPLLATAQTLIGSAGGVAPIPFGSLLTSILRTSNGSSVDLLITALETKGLARRLAEPNLTTLSGDAARFLAGGEFPVPIPTQSSNGFPTVSIDYKKFGVELAFVPTVLSRGVINLRVEPSVSELDFSNAVSIQGTTVPSLTRRDARTTVELRDGQSFAIAGLLQTRNRQDVSQLPWIGSVPVIGSLFGSKSYQQEETDLVIIVTPRLVAPAAPGQQLASPLDSRLPANDVDFFLNGQMEVRKRYDDYINSGGEVKGPYGHIIAPDAVVRAPPPAAAANQPVVKTLN